jgi:hypothetical protein
MSPQERRQVVTLPSSVGQLTAVKHLVLYRSSLVRLPAETGKMAGLEVFEPYTSPRLHWFSYELTRCPSLTSSTVSTRGITGNVKYRPPFPGLRRGRCRLVTWIPGCGGPIRSVRAACAAGRSPDGESARSGCRRGSRPMSYRCW